MKGQAFQAPSFFFSAVGAQGIFDTPFGSDFPFIVYVESIKHLNKVFSTCSFGPLPRVPPGPQILVAW